jgi:hypothetical protein
MRRWLRSELPLLVVVVYLPRIQILVGRVGLAPPLRVGRLGYPGAVRAELLSGEAP